MINQNKKSFVILIMALISLFTVVFPGSIKAANNDNNNLQNQVLLAFLYDPGTAEITFATVNQGDRKSADYCSFFTNKKDFETMGSAGVTGTSPMLLSDAYIPNSNLYQRTFSGFKDGMMVSNFNSGVVKTDCYSKYINSVFNQSQRGDSRYTNLNYSIAVNPATMLFPDLGIGHRASSQDLRQANYVGGIITREYNDAISFIENGGSILGNLNSSNITPEDYKKQKRVNQESFNANLKAAVAGFSDGNSPDVINGIFEKSPSPISYRIEALTKNSDSKIIKSKLSQEQIVKHGFKPSDLIKISIMDGDKVLSSKVFIWSVPKGYAPGQIYSDTATGIAGSSVFDDDRGNNNSKVQSLIGGETLNQIGLSPDRTLNWSGYNSLQSKTMKTHITFSDAFVMAYELKESDLGEGWLKQEKSIDYSNYEELGPTPTWYEKQMGSIVGGLVSGLESVFSFESLTTLAKGENLDGKVFTFMFPSTIEVTDIALNVVKAISSIALVAITFFSYQTYRSSKDENSLKTFLITAGKLIGTLLTIWIILPQLITLSSEFVKILTSLFSSLIPNGKLDFTYVSGGNIIAVLIGALVNLIASFSYNVMFMLRDLSLYILYLVSPIAISMIMINPSITKNWVSEFIGNLFFPVFASFTFMAITIAMSTAQSTSGWFAGIVALYMIPVSANFLRDKIFQLGDGLDKEGKGIGKFIGYDALRRVGSSVASGIGDFGNGLKGNYAQRTGPDGKPSGGRPPRNIGGVLGRAMNTAVTSKKATPSKDLIDNNSTFNGGSTGFLEDLGRNKQGGRTIALENSNAKVSNGKMTVPLAQVKHGKDEHGNITKAVTMSSENNPQAEALVNIANEKGVAYVNEHHIQNGNVQMVANTEKVNGRDITSYSLVSNLDNMGIASAQDQNAKGENKIVFNTKAGDNGSALDVFKSANLKNLNNKTNNK